MKVTHILKKYFFSFLNTDLRLKLIFLKRKTKINLYPDYFKTKGISSVYTRLIFIFLMFEKFFKEIIIKYKIIFRTNYKLENIYFINTFPRSGTTFLDCIIQSEKELSTGTGNGIPKYITNNDEFIFNEEKNLLPTSLFDLCYRNLNLENYRHFYEKINTKEKNYNFIFSHHPIQINDLVINQKKLKEIYLIREPFSACMSYLKHSLNFDNYNDHKKNYNREDASKKLEIVCKNYKIYFNHLLNLKTNTKKLIITYEDLTKNTFKSLERVYSFFNYQYNSENLLKAIEINSKENTLKYIGSGLSKTNRISNYHIDDDFYNELKIKINEIMKKEINDYNRFFLNPTLHISSN